MVKNIDPYKFSLTYQESVNALYTALTGIKRIPKHDAAGNLVPGQYDEIEIPNAYPLLTKEGGERFLDIMITSMDKFNPLANLSDTDCARSAAMTARQLARTITLSADKYIKDFAAHHERLNDWDAFLKNLMSSLYIFATVAKNGHFTNFARDIMSAQNPTPELEPKAPGSMWSHLLKPFSKSE